MTHAFPIFKSKSGKDFVDFDEDLQVKDIINTIKDGYDDIQLVKRYSTEGFGPSQGRHANLNTIRIVAKETGKTPEAIGTTTFRPPLVPEKFGHMAGRAFEPTRLTAMHRSPSGARSSDDAGRALAAARLLWRQGQCAPQQLPRKSMPCATPSA